MARQSRRSAYLGAVGLVPARRTAAQRQGAALDRAYELRTFEIGLVWTRATYFFTVQAAVFAAFGLTAKADAGLPPLIPAMLTLLGLATAWLGFLSARGARFWQQNWEHHIDLLERELEGDLHKTIVHDGTTGYSVSRAQIWLTFALALFWSATAGIVTVWAIRAYRPGASSLVTLLGFLNLTKYPPSLDFLLATLGLGALLLAAWDRRPGGRLAVFGGAPLFLYLMHLYILHLLYLLATAISGHPAYEVPSPAYLWLIAVALLPPLWLATRWFGGVKRRSARWWIRYL